MPSICIYMLHVLILRWAGMQTDTGFDSLILYVHPALCWPDPLHTLCLSASFAAGEAGQVLGNAALLNQLTGLPLSAVLEAEAGLMGALGGDTGAVSALRVLQLYLERLGCTLPVSFDSS